jgi:hypothetical protein
MVNTLRDNLDFSGLMLIGVLHKNRIDKKNNSRSRKYDNQGKDGVHHNVFQINDVPNTQNSDYCEQQYTGDQNIGYNFFHSVHNNAFW